MANENETHAEIVADYRHDADAMDRRDLFQPTTLYLRKALDRLEAAHKREIEATAAKCCKLGRLAGYGASEIKHQQESVGNAAKLREALVKVKNQIAHLCGYLNAPGSLVANRMALNGIINAALAAPERNCDIGTIWEQDERFSAFCNRSFSEAGLCDKACPCRDFNMIGGTCSIVWGQMPHESEVEK